jgi:hypothetical protein
MRSIVTLVVLAFAAGLAPAPAAAQVAGSYELVEVNGHPLPAASPEEADVVVLKMGLLLMPDGHFMMQATATVGGEAEQVEEKAEGTWTVEADSLVLTSNDAEDDGAMRFRWTLEGGTLKLYAGSRGEFTFRRT